MNRREVHAAAAMEVLGQGQGQGQGPNAQLKSMESDTQECAIRAPIVNWIPKRQRQLKHWIRLMGSEFRRREDGKTTRSKCWRWGPKAAEFET
ncbi:hypothetical protein Mp_2g10000 [Marchantia polymorpha subsp. ruderalis]|uniref:Uncharacterized protein n=1 Tax=Marchantia polymorpha TaxID=3197 RepID=A0A2R6W8E9_MARPO|nr:hypothetical protein MARPO_0129s0025 [Marchantia polymorpha]BBN01753.1 hypothetical protein Mp_2g10000 [Marchantia polymorpha subsp. ruderalis]|eukprot:PTQ30136.1 hypothetical protein MARPO_0129s0025 [Marchantia polymorpha]